MEDILWKLNSSEIHLHISAVSDIKKLISDGELTDEYVSELFPYIAKLIKNSHPRIKDGSLNIFINMLEEHYSVIEAPEVSLKDLLSALMVLDSQIIKEKKNSNKKEQRNLVWKAIEIITNNTKKDKWAETIEKFVETKTEIETKCQILDFLMDFLPILSVPCIVRLLEYPKYCVAERAMKMIDFYTPEEIIYIISKIYTSNIISPRNRGKMIAQLKGTLEKAKEATKQKESPKKSPRKTGEIEETIIPQEEEERHEEEEEEEEEINEVILEAEEEEDKKEIEEEDHNDEEEETKEEEDHIEEEEENRIEEEEENRIEEEEEQKEEEKIKEEEEQKEVQLPGNMVQEVIITEVESESSSLMDALTRTCLCDDFPSQSLTKTLYPDSEPPAIALRDLQNHQWMERYVYIEFFLKNLSQTQEDSEMYSDILNSCLKAGYPLNDHVSQILSQLVSTIILFHPEAIAPNINEIMEFALSGALPIDMEEDTISAIYQEIDHTEAVKMAINIADDKPKTGFYATQFVCLVLENEEGFTIDKRYTKRICSFCLHTAKKPEEKRITERLFSLVGEKLPEEYEGFIKSQQMKHTVQLCSYISKQSPKKEKAAKETTEEEDKEEDPINVINEELSKKEKCNVDRLGKAFQKVNIYNLTSITILFQKFLSAVGCMNDQKLYESQDWIKSICRSCFGDPELLNFIANDPQIEQIRSLSKVSYLMPTSIFVNSAKYLEDLYRLFRKSGGNDRRIICVLFAVIKMVTQEDITECSFVSRQHIRVIKTIMNEME